MSRSLIFVTFLTLCCVFGDFNANFSFASDNLKCGISYFNDTEHGHHRIYNGSEAALGQFPWLALLLLGGEQWCTGTITSEEYILTAGHCVGIQNVTKYITVIVGSLNGKGTTPLEVVAYSQHLGFNCSDDDKTPYCKNDVGILKLAKPLVFSNNVQPIWLAASFDGDISPDPDERAIVAGWGWNLANKTHTDNLLYGHEHFVDIETCAREHPRSEIDKVMHICADGKDQHTDHGDSGGPIFIKSKLIDPETGRHRFVQVGINSFMSYPDVFARVSSYCEFISKSTEGKVKCINL